MRNEEKLKKLGLEDRVRFYHARQGNEFQTPEELQAITVCLISLPDGEYVRGIACCIKKDNFVRKLGRSIALGRAIQAIENRQTVKKHFSKGQLGISVYDAQLTDFESNLFRLEEQHLSLQEIRDLEDRHSTPTWAGETHAL